jgi:hypothetical protein
MERRGPGTRQGLARSRMLRHVFSTILISWGVGYDAGPDMATAGPRCRRPIDPIALSKGPGVVRRRKGEWCARVVCVCACVSGGRVFWAATGFRPSRLQLALARLHRDTGPAHDDGRAAHLYLVHPLCRLRRSASSSHQAKSAGGIGKAAVCLRCLAPLAPTPLPRSE